METITSLGAGSGLDLASLVEQLVDAERASAQAPLNQREAAVLTELSAFGLVKSAVSNFQTSLESLKTLASFQGRTTSSSDDTILTASADSESVAGRYNIEVISLASAHKLRSPAFASIDDPVGSGTLTFSSGETGFSVTVDEGTSLGELRDAINENSSNDAITASIVNSVDGAHLIFAANSAGADSQIEIDLNGGSGSLIGFAYNPEGGLTELTETEAASDAEVEIDGLRATSSNNTLSGAIAGVDLTLVDTSEGETIGITVAYDNGGARQLIGDFVNAYNQLQSTLASQTTFDEQTSAAGPLFGDSAIRSIGSEVRSAISVLAEGSATFRALSDIGIDTDLEGRLSIDSERLDDALATDFDAVGSLFAGEDGLASRLDTLLGGFLDPTGRLTTRTDTLEAEIDLIDQRREASELRIESFAARTRAQFTALDQLIAELNNTSTFLGQQLAGLPGTGANN